MTKLSRWLANRIMNFLIGDDGPTAVEYAVMLTLIIVVCIASVASLGKNTNETFSFVGSSIHEEQ
jgi:pilus assembly protein Flp/PilA